MIDLTETPTEALDYEELALVDDVNEPIQTTLAATVATEVSSKSREHCDCNCIPGSCCEEGFL